MNDDVKKLNKEWKVRKKRNWVFATNSNFPIVITLQPNVVDLRYFKLWILLDQIIQVWNIKGLQYLVAGILRLEIWVCVKNSNPLFKSWKKLHISSVTKGKKDAKNTNVIFPPISISSLFPSCIEEINSYYWIFFKREIT